MKWYCLFLVFFVAGIHLPAQNRAFKKLQVEDGLSHNSVICMLQDAQGFMWFGTKDGLNRYDGYNFKLFQRESGNPESIGSNYIRCLEEYGHYIWVGTDTGLFRYDEKSESFELMEGTANQPILDIHGDANGYLWFIAAGSLHRIAIQEDGNTFREEVFNQFSAQLISSNDQGEVFVASFDTLYRFVPDNDSFSRVEPVENDIRERLVITAMSAAGKDTLFIGTKNHGALLYTLSDGRLTKLLDDSENPLYVRDFVMKNREELWIATESGVYIYHFDDHTYEHLEKSYDDPYSLSDNAVYALVPDEEKGMWAGTYFGGVNYYPEQYTPIQRYFPQVGQNSISGNAVREIEKDRYGNLWIGTEDAGLNRFDPKVGTFVNYSSVGEKGALSHYNIHGILPVGDELWVGTFEHGLDVLDIRTGKVVRHYGTGEEGGHLKSDFIFFIYQTRQKVIYVLTSSGIYRYIPDRDTFEIVDGFPEAYHFTCMTEDHNGTLWAGTYWDGLYYFNPETGKKGVFRYDRKDSLSISSNVINGLFVDSARRLWITTENGLNLFQHGSGTFRRYTRKEGLPSNVTYSILEDDRRNLWVSSSNGLVKFTPDSGQMQVYTRSNGLLSDQFNYSSAFKDSDGEMYFGSVKGLISFNPARFVQNNYRPPVFVTDIRINNREVKVGEENSPLTRSILFSDHITLSNAQSTFSLEFASLSYTAPEMTEYWYKLEGLNEEWVSLGKNHRVSFTELPPGDYHLKVKALNSHGVWGEENDLLRISVLPPFSGSRTAYMLYTVLLVSLVYFLLRYYHRYTKDRNNRKIQQLESEKEKEIYQAKIEFFTNIAHEIRTPLTLIKSPLEKLLDRSYRSPEIPHNLEIMQKNTSRLINLVNELLDFRKTEMEHVKLSFVRVNINELLEETYVRFSQLIQERQLHFDLVSETGNIYAFIDEEAVKKILSNLFINAVKYSDHEVRITLRKEGREFVIRFENDGHLISPEHRKRIFEPFFRLPEANREHGSGIGLSLAHSLAELHHGALFMDEEAKEANVFVLRLPIHQDMEFRGVDEKADSGKKPAHGTGFTVDERKGAHIVVAEDNRELADFIYNELSGDYNIQMAENGQQAWEMVSGNDVHLVISDVMMPVLDGIALCRRIKSDVKTSHIPVILLTAKSALNAKIEGLESGADAYIPKPFSMGHLKVQISNLIENRKHILGHYSSSPLAHMKSMAVSDNDKTFLGKLDKVIDDNLADPDLSVDILAEHMHMSRSTLYRKIREISKLSPNELINMSRLKKAVQLLENSELRMYQVAEKVGYKSQTSFGRNFQKHFGMTPTEYLQQKAEEEVAGD
ncbi:hybrid sensor histidine kinase/response regulator transcription factor [Sinomicrobium soli]|uniref:hybrid sensor histidine kinase/response regulator transcription factor n=1 Tax=Sinomicrobium sp. N-1-3-6 TaxID=2219864 RepID=UPI000DCC24D5|nr:hybrid sensor histidine kinase/response regulator transcription factor [Sinomicrobium sp. N-1-3-6]RAV30890.1 hybrid sensor histidine kinase/response regulator [Sinomicrobium sp. N-1-3-6]